MELFIDALLETLKDIAGVFPCLLLAYILMEYLEHRAGEKSMSWLKKSNPLSTVAGAFAGVIPQCGLSAAAANLYAGRVITVGTMLAVFLSTSDEMLPVMVAAKMSAKTIGLILFAKLVVAILSGALLDAVLALTKRNVKEYHIHEFCEKEHCHCEDGILKSAFIHTLKITVFIFVLMLALNYFMAYIGKAGIEYVTIGESYGVIALASLVGLIPNCAVSVALTELYTKGMLSAGALLAGLLVSAGVGTLVLIRVNKPLKNSIALIALLWAIGFLSGCVIKLLGVQFV